MRLLTAVLVYAVGAGACFFGGSGPGVPPAADAGRTARVGLVVATNSPAFRRLLSVADRGGVIVLFVQPGGPGDQAGVSAGDVITAVDGNAVPNAEVGVVALRAHINEDRKLDIVRRNGDKKTITIHPRVPGAVDLRQLYTPLIDQRPNDPLLLYLRAQADQPVADYNKAIADLDRAITTDPQFAEARILRAELEWNLSEQNTLSATRRADLERAALRDWSDALHIDNKNARGISSIAEAIAVSQPQAALRAIKGVLDIDNRLPSAYYASGLAELTRRQYQKAAEAARTAVGLNPYDLRYYELLATSFQKLKRTDDCTKTLQSVFTLLSDTQEKARLLTICS